jgi:hypothetical protein
VKGEKLKSNKRQVFQGMDEKYIKGIFSFEQVDNYNDATDMSRLFVIRVFTKHLAQWKFKTKMRLKTIIYLSGIMNNVM